MNLLAADIARTTALTNSAINAAAEYASKTEIEALPFKEIESILDIIDRMRKCPESVSSLSKATVLKSEIFFVLSIGMMTEHLPSNCLYLFKKTYKEFKDAREMYKNDCSEERKALYRKTFVNYITVHKNLSDLISKKKNTETRRIKVEQQARDQFKRFQTHLGQKVDVLLANAEKTRILHEEEVSKLKEQLASAQRGNEKTYSVFKIASNSKRIRLEREMELRDTDYICDSSNKRKVS